MFSEGLIRPGNLPILPRFMISVRTPFRLPSLWVLRAFLVVALAGGLGGCGNDPHPKPLHTKREDGTPWVVRYAYMPDDPRSLDPQFAYDQMSRLLLEPVYDTLLEYHRFKTDPFEVVPCQLEKMPERVKNADGTEDYVCRLKKGILFHDDKCFPDGKGREVTVRDVEYAWKRIVDPKVECPALAPLEEYVVGMEEAYEEAKKSGNFDYSKPFKGFEVVDDQTFRIHLLKAYPQILYWMAMHFTCPVAREAVEYYDGKEHPDGPGGQIVQRPAFQWHPVGTGAFMFDYYEPASRARLIRNPHYATETFPSDGIPPENVEELRPYFGHTLPIVDEAQITVFREQTPIPILFRQGYLDNMGVNKDAFNKVVTSSRDITPEYKARGVTMEKEVDVSTFFTTFNMQDKVVGPNKKLRQALSCSYDTQSFVDIFWNGVAPAAQQLMPPGFFGYDANYRNPYGFNLEKARKLLEEAGYPGGIDPATHLPLELTIDAAASGSEERQMTEFMQKQFEQLGIKVKVIENTFANLLAKEDNGNFQILYGTGWGADYPDPENFYMLFYSHNFPPKGKNAALYKNPEFDRIFEKMATMDNTPERLECVNQLRTILAEDCPQLFEFHKAFYGVSQPWAGHTKTNMMLEGGLKYARVDVAMRERLRKEWNQTPTWPIALAVIGIIFAGGYAVQLNRKRND